MVFYFTYAAALTVAFNLSPSKRLTALAIPLVIYLLGSIESSASRPWTGILRDWLPPLLVLLAYLEMDWFYSVQRIYEHEMQWASWDRIVLDRWGLRFAIESGGVWIASALEVAYSLLYAVPAICIAVLYLFRRRDRLPIFFLVFLLGSLSAYALLPYFPTASPYLEFPGQDLPSLLTSCRRFNLWILKHADITTSVFPSGHVAVAFSSAFGMILALPEKKWVGRVFLFLAATVFIATIYGRYHYAVDGLFSILLSTIALGAGWMVRGE